MNLHCGSIVEELHKAHKARLARINAAAKLTAPMVVSIPIQEPEPEPVKIEVKPWFSIEENFPEKIFISTIKKAVAGEYGLNLCELDSNRRSNREVIPRQIAMYLAKRLTGFSLADIGRRFGGKDHTTVLYAVRKIENRIKADPQFSAHVASLSLIAGGSIE